MQYRIGQLAALAGVSLRTLRWYERLGLLQPARLSNGYRVYGQADVERLQHILFYREFGLSLKQIHKLMRAPDYDAYATLSSHLTRLTEKRARLDDVIEALRKTMTALKGGIDMSDQARFEAFKREALAKNEQRYGQEIRARYGDKTVEASNAKFAGLSQEQHAQLQALTERLHTALREAFERGNPASERAREACELHREWLCYYWPDYCAEKHGGVVQMYVDDARFTAHYDAIAPDCAAFLRDAVWAWTEGSQAAAQG
jgi:DNA-binding transcriptional MerR regulator